MAFVPLKGRGAASDPANRFEALHFDPSPDFVDPDPDAEESPPPPRPTLFYRDATRSILSRNDSPDLPFGASVNPYRGCEHGCIYCYARPTHEYLGLSAGLDFESRIFVKMEAPALLRDELASPRWRPQVISMSGVTDPYQPVERRLELTRGCLAVLADFRNPVVIITKNHLVTRDRDLLAELARHGAAAVAISLTSLDPSVQRVMEPRTSSPSQRLRAIELLSESGIPVRVMIAPVIPGLTDHEIPAILAAAKDAGATGASWIPVRLPGAVAPLFEEWLSSHFPDRRSKILNRIRAMRGGRLNDPRFGERMRGRGLFADQLSALFETTFRRLGFDREGPPLSVAAFRRPAESGQLGLFDEVASSE